MATQTTGGGSTTSFTNTPQAKDDNYTYLEDLLRSDTTLYNVATNTITLDVMSNDLGGNAKTLFSVEDGDGNPITSDYELLNKDVNAAGVSPWEETFNHNWVRINNGKIEYRIADGSGIPGQGRSVDSLTAGQVFSDQFVYSIRLGNGTLSEATVKISITGANDAATIAVVGTPDTAVTEAGGHANAVAGDPSASGQLQVSDADLGQNKFQDPTAGSLHGTYGNFTFNSTTGQWTYTLDNGRTATEGLNQGDHVTDTLTVTSLDGTATYTITVNVTGSNDAPVAVADIAVATEDGSLVTGSVATNDHDVDSAAVLSFAVNGSPPAGFTMASNGSWSFDPTNSAYDHIAQGATQDVIVNYTVTDEHGATDVGQLTITVTGVNDAPTSANGSNSTNEDTPLSSTLPAATDVDGDAITYSLGTNAAHGNVVVNPNGTFTYTPNGNYNGSDSFTFTVSDGHGGSNTYTYSLNVIPVNDAPTSSNGSGSTSEDVPLSSTLPAATDVDGDSVTYALGTNAAHGNVVVNANGTFTYTPTADYNGSDSFTFTVSDGHGGSNSYTYSLTVGAVADIVADSATTNEDTAVITNVLANDTFENAGRTITAVTQGAHGTVVNNGNGTITYTPVADYNGSDSYTYTVTSGGVTETTTVSVTINPVADAVNDTATTNAGTAVTTNVLANDNFEGSPVVTNASNGAHGTVTFNGTSTTYTPNAGYSGPDSYTYTVTSGGVTESATVNVTVQNPSPPPTANDDVWVLSDTAIPNGTITAQWVLNNDTDTVPGPDFYVSSVSGTPAWLQANFVGGHLVGFSVIGAAVAGNYTFTYTLSDGISTDTATVTLTVLDTTSTGGGDNFTLDGNDFSWVDLQSGNDSITGDVVLTGNAGTDIFVGNNGNDTLNGGAGNDQLFGNENTDTLNGGTGDDFLDGGNGNDTLTGGGGNDFFVLSSVSNPNIDTITDYSHVAGNTDTINITQLLSVASGTNVISGGYLRVTTTGLIQIDTNGGGDNWQTVGNVNTSAGLTYNIQYLSGGVATTVTVSQSAPPIGIDLDGDGHVSFIGTDAGATFDYGGGKVATAWVAPNDGILVNDANHDGQVSASEMVFATSGSDLEGLAAYDSNHDGQLSSADAGFADFAVWQDSNSNGVVDAGEMKGLTALGIASISLTSDGIGYSAAGGDVQVVGTGSYTRTDGSTGVLADAVFATGASQDQKQALAPAASNAALIGAIAAAGLASSEPLAAAVAHDDGHSSARTFDAPIGDGFELSPAAASAVAKLQFAEQLALADHGAPASKDESHEIASQASAHAPDLSMQAAAPSDLPAGTDMPAHNEILSVTPLAAPSVAMPSAAQLAAVAAPGAEGVQHNQIVGQVLADALHGSDGPNVDMLLASLPGQEGNAVLGGMGQGNDALASIAHDLMPQHLSIDVGVLHPDVPPPA